MEIVFIRESGSWGVIKHIIKPCEILEIVQVAGFASKFIGSKVLLRESGSWGKKTLLASGITLEMIFFK